MKLKHVMTMITAAALASACTQTPQNLKSGIDLANLDTTVLPGTDFYQYATGGWQKANPLTAEYSRYGSFDVLQENNNKQLRELIDSVASLDNAPGSIEQKIADLYNSAMDSVTLNESSHIDLDAFLACDGYQNSSDITEMWFKEVWPRMQRQGVDGLFNFYIGADEKDSKNNILSISQGGLTLRQKDYYLDDDESTKAIRQAFVSYIKSLSQHSGFSEKDANRIAEDVMRIETRLAKASRSMTELRDPEANYNKMTYEDLKKDFPGIEWDEFFANFGISGLKEVVVGQPEAIHEVEKILAEEGLNALQNVYLWHAIDMASSYIDDESRALNFGFWGKAMSGRQEDRPRWKRAVSSVEGCLGEALGQLYVAKYFPPAAKERMEKLVANLQIALGERIDVQEWMSDETKKVAREKLDAFYVKVGYPNKWRDYSTLEIGKGYLNNMLACTEWGIKDMIEKHLNKPVDRDEWYMTPQTVNAYYNPTTNEICFPAAILQSPFFDVNADDATNYGAIGVVIGHEMTHGFDDQGRMFNADGNMIDWWTAEDSEKFTAAAEKLAQQFDEVVLMKDLHANGHLTLGENIADQGGLRIAYDAFRKTQQFTEGKMLDGFTPAQRFYLSYGRIWAENRTEESIFQQTKSDPHSIGRNRVNVTLRNIDTFFDAFGIKKGDKMWRDPADRAIVW